MHIDGDPLDAMRLLAHLYLVHGRPEQALVLLRALRILCPDDARVMRLQARCAIRAGRPAAALALVEDLLDAGDGAPVVHLLLGQALAGCGRAAEAQRAFADFAQRRLAAEARQPETA